jgi:hypothetical protein
MSNVRALLGAVLLALLGWAPADARAAALDLSGYADDAGAISVQHRGATSDPYFALQALLLAHEQGLDVSATAKRWVEWMLPRQKPDGTFDRYCRTGTTWAACKTADADDSLLALWLRLLETQPEELKRNAAWAKSHEAARASLKRLEDKGRGIYMVSPVYLHGLFMDNLEVWTYRPAQAGVQSARFPDFGKAIHETFWDPAARRYHVSTQLEQRTAEPAFYPDAVAQIFPLLVNFPHVPGGAAAHYKEWMRKHRAEWLRQVKTDFAWGLIAVAAVKQNDPASARCWLRAALPARNGPHWTVTDEVVAQVLAQRKLTPATDKDNCL